MKSTIMNMFNIIVQHTIKIFKYHPPYRQMCHFCSTNYTTGHDLNSNASLDMALKTDDPNMILGQVCSSSFLCCVVVVYPLL